MIVKDIRNSSSDDDNECDSIGFRNITRDMGTSNITRDMGTSNITRDMGTSFNIAIVYGRESMTSEINNDLAVTFKEAF